MLAESLSSIPLLGPAPVNTKNGCICRNQGRPVDGQVFISPACKVHYAETRIPRGQPLVQRQTSKTGRVHYPKMTVAKP